jgi:hypothetical protein
MRSDIMILLASALTAPQWHSGCALLHSPCSFFIPPLSLSLSARLPSSPLSPLPSFSLLLTPAILPFYLRTPGEQYGRFFHDGESLSVRTSDELPAPVTEEEQETMTANQSRI